MSQRFAPLKRFLRAAQTAWSIVGITLVLILGAEGLLRVYFRIRDAKVPRPYSDRRLLDDGYRDAPWAAEQFDEIAGVEARWQPYVYFRQKEFQGKHITVDAQGIRATWTPAVSPADADRKPLEILAFGGSTMWGYGARDDATIPSYVAQELDRRGIKTRVKNLGELGYVSTQELITLIRELQRGARPDVVIFYDGVNDTVAAILDREAGLPENEGNRIAEFNVRRQPGRLLGMFLAALIKDSGTYRLAESLQKRLRGMVDVPAPPIALAPLSEAGQRKLADEVVDWYAQNVRVVEMLGREYHFQPLFYWQPILFTKANRCAFEDEERHKYVWGEPVVLDVYQRIGGFPALKSDPRWRDISQIFGKSPDLLFSDYCHTTERGNAIIAKTMADDVEALVKASRPDESKKGPR